MLFYEGFCIEVFLLSYFCTMNKDCIRNWFYNFLKINQLFCYGNTYLLILVRREYIYSSGLKNYMKIKGEKVTLCCSLVFCTFILFGELCHLLYSGSQIVNGQFNRLPLHVSSLHDSRYNFWYWYKQSWGLNCIF